jgi:hypothetical protein
LAGGWGDERALELCGVEFMQAQPMVKPKGDKRFPPPRAPLLLLRSAAMAWTRKLTPPIGLKDDRRLETLADVRELMLSMPESHLRNGHWVYAGQLLMAAATDKGVSLHDVQQQLSITAQSRPSYSPSSEVATMLLCDRISNSGRIGAACRSMRPVPSG